MNPKTARNLTFNVVNGQYGEREGSISGTDDFKRRYSTYLEWANYLFDEFTSRKRQFFFPHSDLPNFCSNSLSDWATLAQNTPEYILHLRSEAVAEKYNQSKCANFF